VNEGEIDAFKKMGYQKYQNEEKKRSTYMKW